MHQNKKTVNGLDLLPTQQPVASMNVEVETPELKNVILVVTGLLGGGLDPMDGTFSLSLLVASGSEAGEMAGSASLKASLLIPRASWILSCKVNITKK